MLRMNQTTARSYYDLHIHSRGSQDSQLPVKWIITRCAELGLAGFAVTDHDVLTKVKCSYPELLAIPGEEVSTSEGHVLALGISEQISVGLSPLETIELIHDQGAVAIASHPFSSKEGFPGLGDHAYGLDLDGLEVTNPKAHVDNSRARKVAGSLGIAKVGGSDAHTIDMIGKGLTVLGDGAETVDDLLSAVRKRKSDGILRV
jgi:predicted metal-dependent phosphoesterase TrpH